MDGEHGGGKRVDRLSHAVNVVSVTCHNSKGNIAHASTFTPRNLLCILTSSTSLVPAPPTFEPCFEEGHLCAGEARDGHGDEDHHETGDVVVVLADLLGRLLGAHGGAERGIDVARQARRRRHLTDNLRAIEQYCTGCTGMNIEMFIGSQTLLVKFRDKYHYPQ